MTTTASRDIATDARYVFAGDVIHDAIGDHLVLVDAVDADDYPGAVAIVCHTVGTPTRFRWIMPAGMRADVTPAYIGPRHNG